MADVEVERVVTAFRIDMEANVTVANLGIAERLELKMAAVRNRVDAGERGLKMKG